MCVITLPRMRQSILVTSQTAMFFPGGNWRPVTPITAADFVQNLVSIDGPGECKPAMQFAAVRTDSAGPGGAITNGSYRSATGFLEYRESITGAGSQAFVRFGTMARLQAGQSGQSLMVVETDVTVDDCGGVIGARLFDVQPYLTGTDDANAAMLGVTDWRPTLRVSKLKGLAVVQDNANAALEYAFMVRTCIDRSAPGAWVALEAAYTNPAAGNSERNTGELNIPAGANFGTRSFYQGGLALRRKSGATGNPRCMLHAMMHAKLS